MWQARSWFPDQESIPCSHALVWCVCVCVCVCVRVCVCVCVCVCVICVCVCDLFVYIITLSANICTHLSETGV